MTSPLVTKALNDAKERYGKVGLLIDDAIDCESRVSRELYGSECLPAWWCIVSSLECALDALRAFQSLFDERSRDLWGVLMVDRYLPERCGERQVFAWDESRTDDSEERRGTKGQIAALVSRLALQSKGGDARFVVECITSYETLREGFAQNVEGITWLPRRTDPLKSLRQRMVEKHERLLRRGPDDEKWTNLVREVAALARCKRAALVTGWELSEAMGRHGPGLPPVEWLSKNHTSLGRVVGEHWRAPKRCACRETSGGGDSFGSSEAICLDRILTWGNRVEGSVPAYDSEARSNIENLVNRFDRGFAYHHWQLSFFPWQFIATLNHDRFHERAALAAQERSFDGSVVSLSRISRVHTHSISNVSTVAEMYRTRQVSDALNDMRMNVELGRPDCIVILGVREDVPFVLNDVGPGVEQVRVYWVSRGLRRAPVDLERMRGGGVIARDGSAVDFAYDMRWWSMKMSDAEASRRATAVKQQSSATGRSRRA